MVKSARLRQDFAPFILIAAMLLVASVAVLQADFTDGLHILPFAAVLSLALGWMLARSSFSDRRANTFALIYGLFFIFFLIGSTQPATLSWQERIIDLLSRQFDWMQKAIGGGISRDGIIFVIQTTSVFWLLGHFAAWYTFRRSRVWLAVLPAGLVLLSVVYYYNGPRPLMLYMAIYAVFALLFIAVTHLAAEEEKWRKESVRFDRTIQFDFVRAGLLASLLALLIAWSLPAMPANAYFNEAFSGAGGPWRSFQDNWTRLFSSLRSYGVTAIDSNQDTLILGGPRNVGNTLVMDIQVSKEPPYGVYWQATTYDTYNDGGWYATESDSSDVVHYPEDGPLNVPFTISRTVITQTVTNYLPNSSLIYAVPDAMTVDRPIIIEEAHDPNGRSLISALRSHFILRQGDRYQVASRASIADATELRQAGTSYPTWITDKFLQLPNTITPRTVALAEELAGGLVTPYEKAIVIRDYLRTNLAYNDQIAAAPADVDPVDYVLFESKEAYCTYYASAMTVMLRSQGVPARLVSGYALGDFDKTSMSYRVRALNAHSWVEVYFPEYGWIQFEPTQSIPIVERLASTSDAQSTGEAPLPIPNANPFALDDVGQDDFERGDGFLGDTPGTEEPGETRGIRKSGLQILVGIALLALSAAVVLAGYIYNKRVEGDIERSYGRLGAWARQLSAPWNATQTPYEQANSLIDEVPDGRTHILALTHQYVLQLFSSIKVSDDEIDLHQEWGALRPLLIRHRIAKIFKRN